MKNEVIALLIAIVLITPYAFSSPSTYLSSPQQIEVLYDGNCNITITDINGNAVITDVPMAKVGSFNVYTANVSNSGLYLASAVCDDSTVHDVSFVYEPETNNKISLNLALIATGIMLLFLLFMVVMYFTYENRSGKVVSTG